MIEILFVLVLVGVALYVVHNVIPMDRRIRILVDVVVILAVLVWLLHGFGYLSDVNFHPGRFKR